MSEYLVWNELGNVYVKIGAVDEAISAYLRAIEMNPKYGWPYSNLALAFAGKGEYDEAVKLYRKSIELFQSNREKAVSWNRLGDAFRQMQDYKAALNAYQVADEMKNPPVQSSEKLDSAVLFPDTVLMNAPSAQVVGKGEHAEDIEENVNSETTSLGEGQSSASEREGSLSWASNIPPEFTSEAVLLNQGNSEQPAIPLGNGENGTRRDMSEWLRDLLQSDARQETRALNREAKVSPKSAVHQSPQGNLIREEKLPAGYLDYSKFNPAAGISPAIEAGSAVLDLDVAEPPVSFPMEQPDDQSYPAVRRGINWEMEPESVVIPPKPDVVHPIDPVAAEIHKYEKIISMNDSNDRAWDTLGKLYKSVGKFDESIKSFERAIQLAPHQEAYHYNLGLVYTVQNRYLEAIEYFQNAVSLNDQYILAHGTLAGCYRRLGRNDEAEDHIKTATPMMADESEYNQACFSAICGDNDRALELLRSALVKRDVTPSWVQADPDLENLRTDARYEAMMQENLGSGLID